MMLLLALCLVVLVVLTIFDVESDAQAYERRLRKRLKNDLRTRRMRGADLRKRGGL